jgi:hypothetical protein
MRIARKCSYCGNLGHNSRTCNNSLSQYQFHLHSSSPSYFATKWSFRKNYLPSSQSYSSLSKSYSLPTLFGTNENSDSYLESDHISTIGSSNKGYNYTIVITCLTLHYKTVLYGWIQLIIIVISTYIYMISTVDLFIRNWYWSHYTL